MKKIKPLILLSSLLFSAFVHNYALARFTICKQAAYNASLLHLENVIGVVVSGTIQSQEILRTGFQVAPDRIVTSADIVATKQPLRFIPGAASLAPDVLVNLKSFPASVISSGSPGSLNNGWAILQIDRQGPSLPLRFWSETDQTKENLIEVLGYPSVCENEESPLLGAFEGVAFKNLSERNFLITATLFWSTPQGILRIPNLGETAYGAPVLIKETGEFKRAIGVLVRQTSYLSFFNFSAVFWDQLGQLEQIQK